MPDSLNDAQFDQAKLTSYALGELSPADSGDVELWLSGDPAARRYVEMVREEASVLRRAFAARAEGLDDDQHEQLTDVIGDRPPRPVLPTLVGVVGVIAAVVLFLVIVLPQQEKTGDEAAAPPIATTEGAPVAPDEDTPTAADAPSTTTPPAFDEPPTTTDSAAPPKPTPFDAQATLRAAAITPPHTLSTPDAPATVRVEVSQAPWGTNRLAIIRVDPREPGQPITTELLIDKQIVASARLHGDLFGPLDLSAANILLHSDNATSEAEASGGRASGDEASGGGGRYYLIEYTPTGRQTLDTLRDKIRDHEESIASIQSLMQHLPQNRRPALEAEIVTHRDAIAELKTRMTQTDTHQPAPLSLSLRASAAAQPVILPIPDTGGRLAQASPDFKFAAAVAAFDLIQHSKAPKPADYDLVLELAELGAPAPGTSEDNASGGGARNAFITRVRETAKQQQ